MVRGLVAGALLLALAARHCEAARESRPEPQLACLHFKDYARRQTCDAANRGDAKSEVIMGVDFASGNGAPVDYATALRLFRLAADQGDAAGEAYLGSMYAGGHGVEQDDAEAARLLRRAADKGNSIGQVDLGDLYVNGRGVPKDDAEARRLYRLAANQGNVEGMNSLAWRLAMGGQNMDEALDWARRAQAVQPKNGAVEDTLAWIFYRQGKPDSALPHALRAVTMVPRCASCQDHLGDICAASGDWAGAHIHWRRALDLSVGQPPDPDWDRDAVKKKLITP